MQEEERLKQERTESAHVVSTSKDKGKRKKELKSPRTKLLRVQHKRNKIKSVRSDCGGEYYDRYGDLDEQRPGPFVRYLEECGIVP